MLGNDFDPGFPYDDPEHIALLKAVAASPDHDGPRLVLADWLDENAYRAMRPEDYIRKADFIRTSVEFANLATEEKTYFWKPDSPRGRLFEHMRSGFPQSDVYRARDSVSLTDVAIEIMRKPLTDAEHFRRYCDLDWCERDCAYSFRRDDFARTNWLTFDFFLGRVVYDRGFPYVLVADNYEPIISSNDHFFSLHPGFLMRVNNLLRTIRYIVFPRIHNYSNCTAVCIPRSYRGKESEREVRDEISRDVADESCIRVVTGHGLAYSSTDSNRSPVRVQFPHTIYASQIGSQNFPSKNDHFETTTGMILLDSLKRAFMRKPQEEALFLRQRTSLDSMPIIPVGVLRHDKIEIRSPIDWNAWKVG